MERRGKIGRFQVMGLLQAARYYLLRGDLEKAKSFGLNRAIFYAWAKRTAGRARWSKKYSAGAAISSSIPKRSRGEEKLGDEVAYVSDQGFFVIGDQIQRPEDYDRQIASRIEGIVPYDEAWKAALNYLTRFPKEVLESQREFYEKIYLPVRDRFEEIVKRYSKSSGGLGSFMNANS